MLILLKIPLGRKRKLYLWKLEKFYSRAEKLSSEIFIKRSRLDEECCMLSFSSGGSGRVRETSRFHMIYAWNSFI